MKAILVTRDKALKIVDVPEFKCRPMERLVFPMLADPLEGFLSPHAKYHGTVPRETSFDTRTYQFACRDKVNGIPAAVFVEEFPNYPERPPHPQNAEKLIKGLLRAGGAPV